MLLGNSKLQSEGFWQASRCCWRISKGVIEQAVTDQAQLQRDSVQQPFCASSLFWLRVGDIAAWVCLIAHTELSRPPAPRHSRWAEHHKGRVDKTVDPSGSMEQGRGTTESAHSTFLDEIMWRFINRKITFCLYQLFFCKL